MRDVTWTVFASLILSAVPLEGSQPPAYRPAPPSHNPPRLPQQAMPNSAGSVATLRGIFKLMLEDYKDKVNSSRKIVSSLLSGVTKKPEGYKAPIFYTATDAEVLLRQMQASFDDAVIKISQKLSHLEATEKKGGFLPVSELSQFFMRDLFGGFDLVRKNNDLVVSSIQKQVAITEALKQCPSSFNKAKESLETVQKTPLNLFNQVKKSADRGGKPADASPPQNKRPN